MSIADAGQLLFPVSLFVLGLLLGSFANVLIARIPGRESIVWPGSKCPRCGAPIHWYDNVPVLSWLLLKGRCRACKNPISFRYPLVELMMGALFLAAYQRFGISLALGSALALIFLLVPLTWIDLEHWILPFELTLPGIGLGLLLSAAQGMPGLIDSALGAAGGFILFWGMEKLGQLAFKKEALGGGDKYLLAMLGAFLSYRSLLFVVLLSSFQGSIVGLTLLALRGRAGPAPSGSGAQEEEAQEEEAQEEEAQEEEAQEEGRAEGAAAQPDVTPSPEPPSSEEPPPAEPPQTELTPASADAAPTEPPVEPLPSASEPPQTEPDHLEEEDDWEPGPTNMPFGPWLALAGLEVLLLGPWMASVLPPHFAWLLGGSSLHP